MIQKQLECLMAWRDFYYQNNRYDDTDRAVWQITAFKIKHGIE